jgi:hypothetical protein
MDRLAELQSDFEQLEARLSDVLEALDDPDSKINGSDAAAVARERRALGELIAAVNFKFDRTGALRADYDQLGKAFEVSSGSSSAVVVRERRMISELLEQLETPEVIPLVDRLAAKRAESGDPRPPARRRLSR